MRIILDNIIFSLQKAGGISGAWAILIKELLKSDSEKIYFVERDDACENIFRAELTIPPDRIIKKKRLPLKLDRYLPVKLEGEDAPFIFHSSYYRSCCSNGAINVITLHDFIYEQARTHSLPATIVHSWQKKKALKHATTVACVSNHTLSLLKEYYPHIQKKIHTTVIPNPPVCSPVSEIIKTDSYNKFLLYVGDRRGYKNFMQAAEAAEIVGFPLIIAGAPLSKQEKLLIQQRCPALTYRVEEFPDNKRLSQLYASSYCLLYPSSYEGFGIPVIEAQAHGCPVIIGPSGACKEVGGNAVLCAHSPHTIADNIALLNDKKMRSALIHLAYQNVTRFTPEAIADQYRTLYHSLLY